MNPPALGAKTSWAGSGTTQESVNSCSLYLFRIAIKKPKTKRVNKKGSGEQQTTRPDAVWSTATTSARRGRTSLRGARLSSLREMRCAAGLSEQEREGEPDAMEQLSASAQCVVITSKIQAIFSTRASVIYNAAAKVYFAKLSLGGKLQR